jgi:hypothetical protein
MDAQRRDEIVTFCRETIGDPLRSVLAYELDGTSVEPAILYVRDDIRAEYVDGALEDAARDIVEEVALESVSADWLEHLHRFGETKGTVRVFDRATVVHCWLADEGLSLGWDPGAAVDLESFVRELHARAAADPEA